MTTFVIAKIVQMNSSGPVRIAIAQEVAPLFSIHARALQTPGPVRITAAKSRVMRSMIIPAIVLIVLTSSCLHATLAVMDVRQLVEVPRTVIGAFNPLRTLGDSHVKVLVAGTSSSTLKMTWSAIAPIAKMKTL